ncbi:MAG: ParB/RepB/Spo0J family partition protein [Candidatus Tectimicrobiota bacterium]
MPAQLCEVPLTAIALDDTTFLVTYRPAMQALQHSVARMGVLTPVHLRQSEPEAPLQVICGSKRLLACQQSGRPTVPALLYTAAELSVEAAFLLAVYDNLGCRDLNLVEKARVLRRLRQDFHYPVATVLQEFCPLLDVSPRPDILADYELLPTLDEALQAAVVDGTLPLETALWIGRQAGEDLTALLALFTGLKLGINRAREYGSLIDETCQREICGAAALLQRLGILSVLAEPQLSGPQKSERVRYLLRQARYPQLSAYEQRFQEASRLLRLPPQIQLRPPPYFDGQAYQVSLHFSQPQELQQYAERLLEAARHEALERLLELL